MCNILDAVQKPVHRQSIDFPDFSIEPLSPDVSNLGLIEQSQAYNPATLIPDILLYY